MTFIDDFSCYTEVVLLNQKDKTLDAFKKFVMCAKSKLGRHIVHFRLDGVSSLLKDLLNIVEKKASLMKRQI